MNVIHPAVFVLAIRNLFRAVIGQTVIASRNWLPATSIVTSRAIYHVFQNGGETVSRAIRRQSYSYYVFSGPWTLSRAVNLLLFKEIHHPISTQRFMCKPLLTEPYSNYFTTPCGISITCSILKRTQLFFFFLSPIKSFAYSSDTTDRLDRYFFFSSLKPAVGLVYDLLLTSTLRVM